MATMDFFEAALDVVSKWSSRSSLDMLLELKVQLRLVRTFYMCGTKLGKGVEQYCESTLLGNIESAVRKIATETVDPAFFLTASEFLASIGSFGQEIQDLYVILSDGSLPTRLPQEDELVGVIDNLLDNFQDLPFEDLPEDFRKAVDALEEDVRFAKNFICFARLRGLQQSQLEHLLTHIGGFVVNASRLTFMSWVNEDDRCDLPGKISELLQKFKPVEPHAFEIYVQILEASKLSQSKEVSTPECEKRVFGDLVDSLLGYLWELLHPNTASYMVSFEHQMRKLYKELGFLRIKFDEPREKLHDLIGVVICEAGILICSLFMKANEEIFFNRLDHMLLDLLGKFTLIEEEEHPLATAIFVPQANIEKVQEVAETSLQMPSLSQELNDFVVGFDDEAKEISDRLIRGTRRLDIISIVGMPGLGKTTLARKIYESPKITSHFNVVSWCTVSQVYDFKRLLLEILCCVDKSFLKNLHMHEEEDLAELLYMKLKGKRYLIILDDIWDSDVLHVLKRSFPDDERGSRILLTSRLRDVALRIKPESEPYLLRPLSNDESWKLLQLKIFGYKQCPPVLQPLGMQIAQKCKGLPLMIVLAAGFLARTELDAWKEVAKSVIKDISDQCRHIIERSYRHLPDPLKRCFLYFGLFQQNTVIRVRRLLWLWIAEGLVKENEYKSLEDAAEEYMMDLIGRSLVMIAKRGSGGNVKACNLHDLLHDFCVAKGKEEHILLNLGMYNEQNTSSWPWVYSTREHFAKERTLCPRAHSLRIIADQSTYRGHWCNAFYTLKQFKLLGVLDIWGVDLFKSFPSEIELLVHLRYLAIESSIQTIPPSIENLSSLETFILYGGQVSLPDTIWSMKKLRHLYLSGHGYWKLPEGDLQDSSILENLATLSWVHISKENILRKFPNVRRLKCKLFMEAERTRDCKVIIALDFLSRLESLSLVLDDYYHVARDLQFYFPLSLKKLVLSKLCLPWSKFPAAIVELPYLEVLKLHENAFIGEIWDMQERAFDSLRFLELEDLDLVRWMAPNYVFIYVQKLVLRRCKNLMEVPYYALVDAVSLDFIDVFHCKDVTCSTIKRIHEEQMDMGNSTLKLRIFP